MGSVIQFEERAVAALRERLGVAETARADLLAFARGHSGAVSAIHQAVLAALEADSLDALFEIVTRRWPPMLGLDSVALALVVGEQAFRIDAHGVNLVAPQIVERAVESMGEVALRRVGQGHPLFGRVASAICAEALIGVDSPPPFPRGLLLLGNACEGSEASNEGTALLQFLGAALAAMLRRWATTG